MMSKQNKGTLRENLTRFDRRFDHFNNNNDIEDDEIFECIHPGCWTPYDGRGVEVYEDMMGRRNRLHPACYQDGLRKGDYLKSEIAEED